MLIQRFATLLPPGYYISKDDGPDNNLEYTIKCLPPPNKLLLNTQAVEESGESSLHNQTLPAILSQPVSFNKTFAPMTEILANQNPVRHIFPVTTETLAANISNQTRIPIEYIRSTKHGSFFKEKEMASNMEDADSLGCFNSTLSENRMLNSHYNLLQPKPLTKKQVQPLQQDNNAQPAQLNTRSQTPAKPYLETKAQTEYVYSDALSNENMNTLLRSSNCESSKSYALPLQYKSQTSLKMQTERSLPSCSDLKIMVFLDRADFEASENNTTSLFRENTTSNKRSFDPSCASSPTGLPPFWQKTFYKTGSNLEQTKTKSNETKNRGFMNSSENGNKYTLTKTAVGINYNSQKPDKPNTSCCSGKMRLPSDVQNRVYAPLSKSKNIEAQKRERQRHVVK